MAVWRKGSFELVLKDLISFFFWGQELREKEGTLDLHMLVSEGPQIASVTRLKTGSAGPCALPGFSVASGLDCLRANSCFSSNVLVSLSSTTILLSTQTWNWTLILVPSHQELISLHLVSFSKTVLLVGVHLPSPRVAVGASRQPFTSRSCLPPEACKLLYGAKWVSAQKIPVLLFYLTKILFSEVFKTARSLALILPLITSLQEVSLLCERLNCKIPKRSLSPSPYWRSGETKAQTGVAQSISGHVGTAAKTPVPRFSSFLPLCQLFFIFLCSIPHLSTFHPLLASFSWLLCTLHTYCGLGTLLDTGGAVVSKEDIAPIFMVFTA